MKYSSPDAKDEEVSENNAEKQIEDTTEKTGFGD